VVPFIKKMPFIKHFEVVSMFKTFKNPNRQKPITYVSWMEFVPVIRKVSQRLRSLGISNRIDDTSASIGKRYSRNDELGTPLGITVDFDSVDSITLRDRDSTKQVRASQDEIIAAIKSFVEGQETWEEVFKWLPEFLGQSTD